MSASKPITFSPTTGGKLITRADSTDAGLGNYTQKINWRRDITREMTREGHDYFFPFGLVGDYLLHPFPGTTSPITLIHRVVRPNGETSLVVGTKTTLYRFRYDLSGYIEAGYMEDIPSPYFEVPTRWQVIGSGFSSSGRRWEVEAIDGTSVFNNGVDLPQSFRHEWDAVVPLYELREQGVVSIGTISKTDGVLVCGDITELSDGAKSTTINVLSSGAITVSQTGYKTGVGTSTGTVVTAASAVFSASDVGREIVWSSGKRDTITTFIGTTSVIVSSGYSVTASLSFYVTDKVSSPSFDSYKLTSSAPFFTAQMVGTRISWADGSSRRIVGFVSSTVARTDVDVPVSVGPVKYENPIAYASSTAIQAAGIGVVRRQYRVLWSELNKPTQYALLSDVSFSIGSRTLSTNRMLRSLNVGDEVTVVGAGLLGGSLTQAVVTSVGPGAIQISIPALSSVDGQITRSSSVGSIVGYYDLQDDGSGILKMASLAGRLIVYKDTNLFIGKFTGVSGRAFTFELVRVPHGRSLYYRNTLVSLQDTRHVFAGRDRFYSFDLTTRQPVPIPDCDLVADQFFTSSRITDTESIYAVDNHLTQEFWVVSPNSSIPTLCWDYLYSSFSQTDFAPTAASVIKQSTDRLVSESGDMFLMGTSGGTLIQYGLCTEPNPAWTDTGEPWMDGRRVYYRRSANPYSATKNPYTATISTGRGHLGDPYNEKQIERYVIGISSSAITTAVGEPSYQISFYQSRTVKDAEVLIGTATAADVDQHGMIPIHAKGHLFRELIVATVNQTPSAFHDRTYDVRKVQSKSHHRL